MRCCYGGKLRRGNRKLMERAKEILERHPGLTEGQAYLSLQPQSRQKRTTMKEIAKRLDRARSQKRF